MRLARIVAVLLVLLFLPGCAKSQASQDTDTLSYLLDDFSEAIANGIPDDMGTRGRFSCHIPLTPGSTLSLDKSLPLWGRGTALAVDEVQYLSAYWRSYNAATSSVTACAAPLFRLRCPTLSLAFSACVDGRPRHTKPPCCICR